MDIGVMIFDERIETTVASKSAWLDTLGTNKTRAGKAVVNWKGKDAILDAWKQEGKELFLTISHDQEGATYFAPDPKIFKAGAKEIIAAYNPLWVFIENEEMNTKKHLGSVDAYIPEFVAGCEAAHELGYSCSNGGFMMKPLRWVTYREMLKTDPDNAARFLNSIPEGERDTLVSRKSKSKEKQIDDCLFLLNEYAELEVDAITIHPYPNDLWAMEQVINYVKTYGRPLITNEYGLLVQDGNMLTGLNDLLVRTGFLKACYFSGHAWKLLTPTGLLTKENGVSMQNYLSLLK
jgi:hypothetical protein